MRRADGNGVVETERCKIGRKIVVLVMVDLVDRHHDWLARSAQHAREVFVDR